jgi:hypothetical protein
MTTHHLKSFILLLALIILIVPVVVLAQDDGEGSDPFFSDPDNWCDPGEPWDGYCSRPEMTPEEQAWAWKCGWYFARIETGVLQPGDLSDTILSNCFFELELPIPEDIPDLVPRDDDGGEEGGEEEGGQEEGGEDILPDDGRDEGGEDVPPDEGGQEGGEDVPPDEGGSDDVPS